MKRLLHRLPSIRFMIVICAILLLTFQNFAIGSCQSTKQQLDSGVVGKFATEGLVVYVKVGHQDIIRLGRQTLFDITIQGEKQGFEGEIMIHLPDAEGDSIVYKKHASVNVGGVKSYYIEVPVRNLWADYAVELVNTHNETVLYKEFSGNVQNDMTVPYVGVISDKLPNLYYLESMGMRINYIEENEIPEQEVSWGIYDYIIIDDYDLSRWNQEQTNSLKQWIKKGGVLVVGTGATYEKTIIPLEKAGLLEADQVERELEPTYYGYSRKEIQERLDEYNQSGNYHYEVRDLMLEKRNFRIKGSSVLCKDDKPVIERCVYGSGRILVFHFQLSSSSFGRQFFEQDILKSIQQNLSTQRSEQVAYQYLDTNITCNRIVVVDELGNDGVPSILLYSVIIFVYVIAVIPLMYIFLIKIKKQKNIWGCLLGVTILFTMLMLGVSRGSRDTVVKSNSMNFLFYKNHEIMEQSIFNIMIPYDDKYEFHFSGPVMVEAFNDHKYVYYPDVVEGRSENYPLGDDVVCITQEDTYNRVKMENMTAFQKKYFKAEKKYEVEGDYTSDFICDANGISGSFHNNMGYLIRDAFYIGNGAIAYLGDIENGKSSGPIQEIHPLLNISNTEVASFAQQYLPQGSTNTAEADAICAIVTSIFEDEVNPEVVVGFVGSGYRDGIGTQLGEQTKMKDVNLLVLPVKSKARDTSEEYIYTLGGACEVIEGKYSYGDACRYLQGTVTIKHQLPSEDQVKRFEFPAYINQEYHMDYNAGFNGQIYFYNRVFERFDEVFKNGEGTVWRVDQYLDNNNCIIVKYQVDDDVTGEYLSLPYISYSKEAR